MEKHDLDYSDYLRLPVLLNLQQPVSFQPGFTPAHDEMLFVVIHQSYELWFRQLLFELESVTAILAQPSISDNSPALQTVVHRAGRMNAILKTLVQQMDIMETMTPMDFLDFRDLLKPASGFQSWQFKILEARLGLRFEQRQGQQYYLSALRPEYVQMVKEAESKRSLLTLMNDWLGRMPFFSHTGWMDGHTSMENETTHPFWQEYRRIYASSLSDNEQHNLGPFDQVLGFDKSNRSGQLTERACRSALFIMLYRGFPMLQLPFQLLNACLELDDLLSTWRYRHMNMVHRMIGQRVGTGGSSGRDYLKKAADAHYIFKELAQLSSFLIERSRLPALPTQVSKILGFDMS